MTSLSPRVVFVTRETDYELLLARNETRQQTRFFLESRGQDCQSAIKRDPGSAPNRDPLDGERAVVDHDVLGRPYIGDGPTVRPDLGVAGGAQEEEIARLEGPIDRSDQSRMA